MLAAKSSRTTLCIGGAPNGTAQSSAAVLHAKSSLHSGCDAGWMCTHTLCATAVLDAECMCAGAVGGAPMHAADSAVVVVLVT
jgi:hypothetical protein